MNRTHICSSTSRLPWLTSPTTMPACVHRVERRRHVARGQHQVMPLGFRKMPPAIGRAVQLVQMPGARDAWNQNAARLAAVARSYSIDVRPRGDRRPTLPERRAIIASQLGQLVAPAAASGDRSWRPAFGCAVDREDGSLAAFADQRRSSSTVRPLESTVSISTPERHRRPAMRGQGSCRHQSCCGPSRIARTCASRRSRPARSRRRRSALKQRFKKRRVWRQAVEPQRKPLDAVGQQGHVGESVLDVRKPARRSRYSGDVRKFVVLTYSPDCGQNTTPNSAVLRGRRSPRRRSERTPSPSAK